MPVVGRVSIKKRVVGKEITNQFETDLRNVKLLV